MILKLSSWLVCQPKFMVPRQMLLTNIPCFPKRLCSIAIFNSRCCSLPRYANIFCSSLKLPLLSRLPRKGLGERFGHRAHLHLDDARLGRLRAGQEHNAGHVFRIKHVGVGHVLAPCGLYQWRTPS